MKKINCISVDADSLEWLANAVQASHVCKGSAELSRALRELAQGRADTLMLECGQPSPADDGMTFGELTIYQKSRRVVCAGQEVQLTPKEFDILFLSYSRKNSFIKPFGWNLTTPPTAISWPLSENCAKRLNQTRMLRNIFSLFGALGISSATVYKHRPRQNNFCFSAGFFLPKRKKIARIQPWFSLVDSFILNFRNAHRVWCN